MLPANNRDAEAKSIFSDKSGLFKLRAKIDASIQPIPAAINPINIINKRTFLFDFSTYLPPNIKVLLKATLILNLPTMLQRTFQNLC